jgi:hypothetical protein
LEDVQAGRAVEPVLADKVTHRRAQVGEVAPRRLDVRSGGHRVHEFPKGPVGGVLITLQKGNEGMPH